MQKIIFIFIVVLGLLFSSACVEESPAESGEYNSQTNSSDNTASSVNRDSADPHSLIYANSAEDYNIETAVNAFAFDMYENITSKGNVFFSPYSIFTAMAICYDGSEEKTQQEISYVFYYPLNKELLRESSGKMKDTINSDNNAYVLDTANALWVRQNYPLNRDFVLNSKKYYGGNVTGINFFNEEEARSTINDWVSLKTNDRIKELIPPEMITGDTALIITNAVYFKGKWLSQFDSGNTAEEDFYNSSGGRAGQVDMMYTSEYFRYGENENAQIVELPYEGDDLCMYIVLPGENNIEHFEAEFSLSDYNKLKSSMESDILVRTWLPKFKFDSKFELAHTLQNMGVKTAFTDMSNLSGIYDTEKVPEDYVLMLDDVVHQAFIDVQEEGTEAAAATAVEATDSAGPDELRVVQFKADHPFMFFIEDKRTGCILFMGKLEEPGSESN